jgi:carboxymethylenebutenolidase
MTAEHPFGFLAHPDRGPVPGVVMIPDVWGLSDHYRGLARRLADAGFAALAIDPYRKTGRGDFSDPAGAQAWIRELSDPLVLETVQEAIDTLRTHPATGGRKIGITGFCMGGQYALLAACSVRGLAACVSWYGMLRYEERNDRKPASPLDLAPRLACPFLGLFGAEDALIPQSDVEELRRILTAAGKRFEIRSYAGAGHAFFNDTRRDAYRPDAAADAWPRAVAFLRQHLGGAA